MGQVQFCCKNWWRMEGNLLCIKVYVRDGEALCTNRERGTSNSVGLLTKFASYIIGLKILIETDHKTLVPLFRTKHLDSLPPWILWFRLRRTQFDYTTQHVPGKLLPSPDALSYAPGPWTTTETILEDPRRTNQSWQPSTLSDMHCGACITPTRNSSETPPRAPGHPTANLENSGRKTVGHCHLHVWQSLECHV